MNTMDFVSAHKQINKNKLNKFTFLASGKKDRLDLENILLLSNDVLTVGRCDWVQQDTGEVQIQQQGLS